MKEQQYAARTKEGAALLLLRHKMLVRIGKNANSKYDLDPELDINDVNEILIVAGLPVIMPDDVKKKVLNVMPEETNE